MSRLKPPQRAPKSPLRNSPDAAPLSCPTRAPGLRRDLHVLTHCCAFTHADVRAKHCRRIRGTLSLHLASPQGWYAHVALRDGITLHNETPRRRRPRSTDRAALHLRYVVWRAGQQNCPIALITPKMRILLKLIRAAAPSGRCRDYARCARAASTVCAGQGVA